MFCLNNILNTFIGKLIIINGSSKFLQYSYNLKRSIVNYSGLIWGDSIEVREAMNSGVIAINPNTQPLEAFEKMYKEGVRRLFVMDDQGIPIGVISYLDLVGVLGTIKPSIKDSSNLAIGDIMSEAVITISANDKIEDAANLMLRADVSGLLVLENEKPVGVITKTDICRLVAAEILIPG